MNSTNEEFFARIRDGFDEVRLEQPVERVIARGRSVRRRRVVPILATALVATTVGVSLAAMTHDRRDVTVAGSPSAGQHLALAAWSVDRGQDGLVRLTIRDMKDADSLTATLTNAGVRARVQVVPTPCDDSQPGRLEIESVIIDRGRRQSDSPPSAEWFTIDPAAMPAGTYLSFVLIPGKGVLFSLVDGVPATCVPMSDLPYPASPARRPGQR